MHPERSFGLQWRLVLTQLITGLLSIGAIAAAYAAGVRLGLEPFSALGLGLVAGAFVTALGSAFLFLLARAVKLRLWDAGDLASRIARGDFKARLQAGGPDEIGWLEEQLNRMAGRLDEAVTDLHNLAEQNRRLAEEAGRGAALEERARLARDLHDTVNQQLFALAMSAAALRRRLENLFEQDLQNDSAEGATNPQTVRDISAELASLEQLAREAHKQTRELILHLRPTKLEKHGLAAALEEYAKNLAEREGWRIETEIDRAVRVPDKHREPLFRIAQEALGNVSKHARATTVRVTLEREKGEVVLCVRDDGVGFDPKRPVRPTAVGLIGMGERVEQLGGRLSVDSAPGKGTTVCARVPWTSEESAT